MSLEKRMRALLDEHGLEQVLEWHDVSQVELMIHLVEAGWIKEEDLENEVPLEGYLGD